MARMAPLPIRERGVCSAVELGLPRPRARRLAAILKALADPTRIRMVVALREAREPVCVCDFTAAFELSQPTISHHVGRLRRAGIVEVTRRGVWAHYSLAPRLPEPVRRIVDALG